MVDTVLASSVILKGEEAVQAVAYNVYHDRMVNISKSSVTVVNGGEGYPLWTTTSSWRVPGQSLGQTLMRLQLTKSQYCGTTVPGSVAVERVADVQVAWSHPDYGQVLAVGTASGHVQIWEEEPKKPDRGSTWLCQSKLRASSQAITALSFAPKETGLRLAVASTSGTVRIFEALDVLPASNWSLENEFTTCEEGACTSLSWRPSATDVPQLLLAGSQKGAKVWMYRSSHMQWECAAALSDGQDISAVHWANQLGRPVDLVAVAAGCSALVYSLRGPANQLEVHEVARLEHSSPVWQVEWNLFGNWLATSTHDAQVHLWRANLLGEWSRQSVIASSPHVPVDSDEDLVMVS